MYDRAHGNGTSSRSVNTQFTHRKVNKSKTPYVQQVPLACCWSDSLLPGATVELLPEAGVGVEPILNGLLISGAVQDNRN